MTAGPYVLGPPFAQVANRPTLRAPLDVAPEGAPEGTDPRVDLAALRADTRALAIEAADLAAELDPGGGTNDRTTEEGR